MMYARIARRIRLGLLGYFVSVIAGSAVFWGMLAIIRLFYRQSQIWQSLGLGPIVMLAAPIIFFYILLIILVFTFVQAVILNGLAEVFGWRAMWVHLLIALALGASAALLVMPDWFSHMNADRWLITIAAAMACLLAGLVYWAIAGRGAGVRQNAQPLPRGETA